MPEDEETAKWLNDEALHRELIEFDEQLVEIMDPYFEKIYLREERIANDPKVPFTSSGIQRLEFRFT